MHAVPRPGQMEDGESPFPARPGAPAPLLAGVRTGDKAAAFACGFGGLWSYSRALSSLRVRSERCLSSVITGGWKTGEEVFYHFSRPSVKGGAFYVCKPKTEIGDQDFFRK